MSIPKEGKKKVLEGIHLHTESPLQPSISGKTAKPKRIKKSYQYTARTREERELNREKERELNKDKARGTSSESTSTTTSEEEEGSQASGLSQAARELLNTPFSPSKLTFKSDTGSSDSTLDTTLVKSDSEVSETSQEVTVPKRIITTSTSSSSATSPIDPDNIYVNITSLDKTEDYYFDSSISKEGSLERHLTLGRPYTPGPETGQGSQMSDQQEGAVKTPLSNGDLILQEAKKFEDLKEQNKLLDDDKWDIQLAIKELALEQKEEVIKLKDIQKEISQFKIEQQTETDTLLVIKGQKAKALEDLQKEKDLIQAEKDNLVQLQINKVQTESQVDHNTQLITQAQLKLNDIQQKEKIAEGELQQTLQSKYTADQKLNDLIKTKQDSEKQITDLSNAKQTAEQSLHDIHAEVQYIQNQYKLVEENLSALQSQQQEEAYKLNQLQQQIQQTTHNIQTAQQSKQSAEKEKQRLEENLNDLTKQLRQVSDKEDIARRAKHSEDTKDIISRQILLSELSSKLHKTDNKLAYNKEYLEEQIKIITQNEETLKKQKYLKDNPSGHLSGDTTPKEFPYKKPVKEKELLVRRVTNYRAADLNRVYEETKNIKPDQIYPLQSDIEEITPSTPRNPTGTTKVISSTWLKEMGVNSEETETKEKYYTKMNPNYNQHTSHHSSQHSSRHSSRHNSPTSPNKNSNFLNPRKMDAGIEVLENLENGKAKFVVDPMQTKDLYHIQFSGNRKSELPTHHIARFENYLKNRNLSKNLPEDDVRGEVIIQRFGETLKENAQTWYEMKVRVFEPEDDEDGFCVPRTIKDWNKVKKDFIQYFNIFGQSIQELSKKWDHIIWDPKVQKAENFMSALQILAKPLNEGIDKLIRKFKNCAHPQVQTHLIGIEDINQLVAKATEIISMLGIGPPETENILSTTYPTNTTTPHLAANSVPFCMTTETNTTTADNILAKLHMITEDMCNKVGTLAHQVGKSNGKIDHKIDQVDTMLDNLCLRFEKDKATPVKSSRTISRERKKSKERDTSREKYRDKGGDNKDRSGYPSRDESRSRNRDRSFSRDRNDSRNNGDRSNFRGRSWNRRDSRGQSWDRDRNERGRSWDKRKEQGNSGNKWYDNRNRNRDDRNRSDSRGRDNYYRNNNSSSNSGNYNKSFENKGNGGNRYSNSNYDRPRSQSVETRTCYHCGQVGHLQRDCPILKKAMRMVEKNRPSERTKVEFKLPDKKKKHKHKSRKDSSSSSSSSDSDDEAVNLKCLLSTLNSRLEKLNIV